jgi:hypothetical protein
MAVAIIARVFCRLSLVVKGPGQMGLTEERVTMDFIHVGVR